MADPLIAAVAKCFRQEKDVLGLVAKDLDDWRRSFDPSWPLIMAIANPTIGEQLERAEGSAASTREDSRKNPLDLPLELQRALREEHRSPVWLPYQELDILEIPLSIAKAGRRRGLLDPQWLIIDSINCRPNSVRQTTKNVRQLASKLSQADPIAFGLLTCEGAVKRLDPAGKNIVSFDLIFSVPDGMDVLQSLRRVLLNPPADISLNRRVRIAKELAKSVYYLHLINIVHQSITPESVLLFEDTVASRSSTFLVGFNNFRLEDGMEDLTGDEVWEKNVYRHPSRQGRWPEQHYVMQHDIYSLGVCLLEIGLWQSFVAYPEDSHLQAKYGKAYSQFFIWLGESDYIPDSSSPESSGPLEFMGSRLKEYLIDLARTKLPANVGEKYAQVVLSCLTCLDVDDEDFAEVEMRDEDGILIGVRFIEKVLMKLDEILL
ncbi:hypothetical protein G7Y89_g11588 [Cudoniella acicularis]|uniref:Protein kinase domain-containing protein n=1 Tax=Cudoniella acicularis TaxID=354080 RepID=A0A8H4RAM7_9HELO|nr:hypothetical protein G7Y89_g11588 [Cudoniella acicularis]